MSVEDEAKYHMRGGMAKTALRIRRQREHSGDTLRDANGRPLKYAQRMADGGVSNRTLEKWIRGKRTKVFY